MVLIGWLGIAWSKLGRWSQRLGTLNQHNASVPRDFWLEDWEKAAIIAFRDLYPLEGYRRLTYMMLDADVVAVNPSSVYCVLKAAGKLARRWRKPSEKRTGFEQSVRPHEHWHIDVSHVNICRTFYFLCSILEGYSRFVIHWEIRETMKEAEVETIVQRAREQFPGEQPRIISDNGPQFVAKDFKEFIRICGMTHVRTSPYYLQSNGKMERWYKTLSGGESVASLVATWSIENVGKSDSAWIRPCASACMPNALATRESNFPQCSTLSRHRVHRESGTSQFSASCIRAHDSCSADSANPLATILLKQAREVCFVGWGLTGTCRGQSPAGRAYAGQ